MSVLATRTPTIRFPQLHGGVEHGQRWRLHWDGTRASNGDGAPGADGAAVDTANTLAGPFSLYPAPVKLGAWEGRAWLGAAWTGNAVSGGLGAWQGPAWIGQAWQPAGFATWRFPFALRDGNYTVAVAAVDALGNAQGVPAEAAFEVAALPRPARDLAIEDYDAGADLLALAWTASPDIE